MSGRGREPGYKASCHRLDGYKMQAAQKPHVAAGRRDLRPRGRWAVTPEGGSVSCVPGRRALSPGSHPLVWWSRLPPQDCHRWHPRGVLQGAAAGSPPPVTETQWTCVAVRVHGAGRVRAL